MDIVKQNIDDLCALLRVQIVKADYEDAVKKSLNAHRRKAEIKGFRTGMAPMSLIQKIYGHSILLEEINKLISESLRKYIENEKLDIIGEPIPCDDEQKHVDWDNQTDFEFVYEIGYTPKYEFNAETIQVPFYNIILTDSDINKQVDKIRINCGKLEDTETVNENDFIKVDMSQDGENAMKVEDTFISLQFFETQEKKTPFLGLKVGDTLTIDINDIYTKDEDKALLLKIKKEELKTISPQFNVTVKNIKTNKKADINQELFDMVYGENIVKNEEEFLQKIAEELAKTYKNESDYRFSIDAGEILITKAELKYPETFLKKWLLLINENKLTSEQIDKNFDIFIKDLSWQNIRNNIAKENDIKVEDADIKDIAMKTARYQLKQYGLVNLPDDQIENFAQRIINDKRQFHDIVDKAIENKVFDYLKTVVKLDEKEITIENFDKLFEK